MFNMSFYVKALEGESSDSAPPACENLESALSRLNIFGTISRGKYFLVSSCVYGRVLL